MFSAVDQNAQQLVYVCAYNTGEHAGIYVFRFAPSDGRMSQPALAAKLKSSLYLAFHPNGQYLYAVGDFAEVPGHHTQGVVAFRTDPTTGELTKISAASSLGELPCHLVVDRGGRFALVANYSSGSACVLPIDKDGRVHSSVSLVRHEGSGPHPRRQTIPHPHSINLDPANRFAFVADLGIDRIAIYQFNANTGKLLPNDPAFSVVPPGSGPRHFAFHPSGRFAYVVNELSQTVSVFGYDAAIGRLNRIQDITTLPTDVKPEGTSAEIAVHPTGKFLYASNRGHDSIAIFCIDPETGRLTVVGHESTQGRTPRGFTIDPSGHYLFAENQESDTIVLFRIDPTAGTLVATGQVLEVPNPVCLRISPNVN